MLSIYVSHVTVALFFWFLPISKQVKILDGNPLEQGEINQTKPKLVCLNGVMTLMAASNRGEL